MKLLSLLLAITVAYCALSEATAWRWGGGWGRGFGWGGGWGYGRGWGYGGYGYGLGGWGGLYTGWGYPTYYYYGKRAATVDEFADHFKCSYLPGKDILTCGVSSEKLVECEATSRFVDTLNFDLYGIERLYTDVKDVLPENIRYNLLPRKLDESGWFNHTLTIDSKPVSYSFFYSATDVTDFYGVRVRDLTCWTKLIDLIRPINVEYKVLVETNVEPVIKGVTGIFGQIRVV